MRVRLVRVVVLLAANTIGLFVASVVLDDLTIGWRTFLIAVAIFTVIESVIHALLERTVRTRATALSGGTSLFSTFLGLLVTTMISDGIAITGFTTWILATVIVWLAALGAGLIIPALLLRRTARRVATR
jgi:low temperature requirement protein LtrA